jgi:hypothetical protein
MKLYSSLPVAYLYGYGLVEERTRTSERRSAKRAVVGQRDSGAKKCADEMTTSNAHNGGGKPKGYYSLLGPPYVA